MISSKRWAYLSSNNKKAEGLICDDQEKELVPRDCLDVLFCLIIPKECSLTIMVEHLSNHISCCVIIKTSCKKLRQISAVSCWLWVINYIKQTNSVGKIPLIKSMKVNWEEW